MTKAAKTRVFLLLLATVTTVLALTPAQPAQACIPYDIEYCQQNGAGASTRSAAGSTSLREMQHVDQLRLRQERLLQLIPPAARELDPGGSFYPAAPSSAPIEKIRSRS